VGQEVASGVLNTGQSVELITTQDSQTSTYAGLIRLVQQAQASSASAVRLANKWAVWFVPFALLLALATLLITRDYHNAVAVIVAATPCPLILAVPVAIIAGMSKAASRGAIIKGGAALELLARTKTILLDKTGTLTHGGPAISEIALGPGFELEQVLSAAGSLEQDSPHVVAQAIVSKAQDARAVLSRATNVLETHGVGLVGTVAGQSVSVGQPLEPLPQWAKLNHSLLVAVNIDGVLAGMFGLDDPVREESKATIDALRKLGVERMILVSGDRRSTVEDVANEVGVDDFYAECSPEQKLLLLRAEQERTTGTVVAVGDGINDAPALAAAGVGVAMGARGATAASEAADVVIIEDSITHLAVAVDIAQGSRARALQAAGVGMGLAIVAMVLGSVGVLNATTAAISQEVIDAGAILWALVPAATRLPKTQKTKRLLT
jgi:heavy metal translocating P-type ATPase